MLSTEFVFFFGISAAGVRVPPAAPLILLRVIFATTVAAATAFTRRFMRLIRIVLPEPDGLNTVV